MNDQGSPATPDNLFGWAEFLRRVMDAAGIPHTTHADDLIAAIRQLREDAAAPGLREALREAFDALESMPLCAMGHAVPIRRKLRAILAAAPAAAADARPAEIDIDKAWAAFHEWEQVAAAGGSGMTRDQWVGASLFWNFLNNHGDTYPAPATADTPEATR